MEIEKIKIFNEIEERKTIVHEYKVKGTLDRIKVINMIIAKRIEDPKVAEATFAGQALTGATPFEIASNDDLIREMELQIAVMEAELL